ncbi:hypothetical protein GCM10009785_09400 [Brooklawnia cerclae]|uniref:Uncharacterized membrane protein YfbV (UPF0208 family) n=1 Tax=Brooklawnia cerclae TaxID=349934 RepID=A0ABX0SLE1_9ACTN|nr:hypothetical protein [Brooklawnia cerclae]NIH58133.1 uncharacterized membrane protein YfbV (UPF0208 family) [Brooklawnia cerclae]
MSATATRDARPVVVAWLVTRALLLAVAWWITRTTGTTFTQVLSNWDVQHYLTIAQSGYRDPLDVAFFPGLPMVMRAIDLVGVPMVIGATVLAQIGSGLAAWAIHRMYGPGAAVVWLLLPMTVFTAVPYTEPLFCAAAFWAWERAQARSWGPAIALACVACSLRISGLFLVFSLGVLVLTQAGRSFRRRLVDCLWLVFPMAVLGAYVFFLHSLSGRWDTWYTAQGSGWQRHLSWPWDAFSATWPLTADSAWPGRAEVPIMFRFEIASVVIGYLGTLALAFRRRWGEAGWVGSNVVALSSSAWFMSVNRAVLLWFPLCPFIASAAQWRPHNPGARAAYRVGLGLLLAADLFVMAWWAWCFGTGRWAS